MYSQTLARINGWRDATINRNTAHGERTATLDGLRAVGVILVFNQIASTVADFRSGPAGTTLLFVISGYLLYSTCLHSNKGIATGKEICIYLLRRLLHIVPLFLVVLLIMSIGFKWPPGDVNTGWLIDHLLLLQSDDHLWPVTLLLLFSFILPLLVIVLAPVRSGSARAVILLGLGILAWWGLERRGVLGTAERALYLSPFLAGMVVVHTQACLSRSIALILILIGMLGILGFSVHAAWAEAYRQWWSFTGLDAATDYSWLVSLPCTMLVLGAVASRPKILGLSWLRLVGVLGYGIYLGHRLVVTSLWNLEISGLMFQVLAIGLSLLFALVAWFLIERPARGAADFIGRSAAPWGTVRLMTLVSVLLGVFLGIRFIYPIDTNIYVRTELQVPQDTLTQVFVSPHRVFTDESSGFGHVQAGDWQTLMLSIPETRLNRIRLDPGVDPGTYYFRSFEIKYPFGNAWHGLPLVAFRPEQGITSAAIHDNVLVIETQQRHTDPYLIYREETKQPIVRPWSATVLLSLFFSMLLLGAFVILDRFSTRKENDNL